MTRATTVPPDSGSGLGGAVPSRLGRAATQSGPGGTSGMSSSSAMTSEEAWVSLATWLRNGRVERGMSIADIARTTKIQARILEDLESGIAEGLPADVFVRGFIRNYARCVGLSEGEALARYAACSRDAGPVASPAATAIAELYAPTTRRMSTVVPVAPGSPAAEVHAAPGPRYERAATSPGYPRAPTSPGLPAQPRMLRAATESGARISGQMPAVTVLSSSVTGSGVVSTSGVQAAIAAAQAPAAPPVAVVAPVGPAVIEPVASVGPASSMAIPVVEVVSVEPVRSAAPEWPRGLKAKKKSKNQKRQERKAQQAAAPVRQRAQTIRPSFENEIYESDDVELSAPVAVEAPVAVAVEAPVAVASASVAPVVVASSSPAVVEEPIATAVAVSALVEAPLASEPAREVAAEPVEVAPSEVWIPKMPPAARPSRAFVAPTLTIDDADPESASVLQDDRARDREGRDPTRRTFLPPILLESQDRANRQGGLTLAVIILLIAATLTLSYLMRRPSSGGGGMTSLDAPVTLIG